MSKTIRWPTRPLFHPFGNTSPVNVAEYVPWNQKANILLLGCGDPRNIFFTLQACGADQPSCHRKFDFTCCDVEPGVIARNILLLTFAVDGLFHERRYLLWNIFYDIFLDQESLSILTEQCIYLVGLSASLSTWRTSQYSEFVRFASASTLEQVRRYWQWYAKAGGPANSFMETLKEEALQLMHSLTQASPDILSTTTCRSAGPMWQQAILTSYEAHCRWWETGLTTNDVDLRRVATRLNPTFACTSFQPGFRCDMSTSPLQAFHLSPACTPLELSPLPPTNLEPDPENLFRVAKAQFQTWLDVFRSSLSFTGRVVVRFAACDSFTLCGTLEEFAKSGRLSADLRLHPFTVTRFVLDRDEYSEVLHWKAPHTFDVIDTCLLSDDMSGLNCILTALPLLGRTPWATLYTETRLQTGFLDPTRGITTSVCGELSAIALLCDLAPVSFISGFDTHSNIQDNLFYHIFSPALYFHERLAWKRPSQLARPGGDFVVAFDSDQLCSLLYDTYTVMFMSEAVQDILKSETSPSQVMLQDLSRQNYTRRSFALLLQLLRRRVSAEWGPILNNLLGRLESRRSAPISQHFLDELRCQVQLLGVDSFPYLEPEDEERYDDKAGSAFCDWSTIPPIVCVVLIIPRTSTDQLVGPGLPYNPRVNAVIDENGKVSSFACLETAFGELRVKGSAENAVPIVDEDAYGQGGRSPWIVSFLAPATLLLDAENTTVSMACMQTLLNANFETKLPKRLRFFTASLMDATRVRVFAQRLTWSEKHPMPIVCVPWTPPVDAGPDVQVLLRDDCRQVKTLTLRTMVDDGMGKEILASDSPGVRVEQIGHCEMRLTMGDGWSQNLQFPFAVNGPTAKLRIARSSGWIEVIVDLGSFEKCDPTLNRFPVIRHMGVAFPWNIHLLMPDRCPQLVLDRSRFFKWISQHMRFAFSDKEREAVDHQREPKPPVQVKRALQTLFTSLLGHKDTPQPQVFAIHRARGGLDSIIIVPAARLDLAAHTVLADAYLLPLRNSSGSNDLNAIRGWKDLLASAYTISLSDAALTLWKQMLPTMAERCRDYRHKIRCSYRSAGRIPISTKFQESPLCECGEGHDGERIGAHEAWAPFGPHATRIALSPLFAVSFLDPVGADCDELAMDHDIPIQTMIAISAGKRGGARAPNLQLNAASMPSSFPQSATVSPISPTDTEPALTPTKTGNECRGCGKAIPDGVVKVKDWKSHKPHCSPRD
ncbi:hypothetical protein PsYK624_013620 [Phanerochaete sordida]|uniref:DUF4470 domain-containing protein n=1 Tax=Phanerochaete sordida TaxID=48140 RepID=A0A9P3FZ67_9APHY|nr:hypothetical protein PsYK624_013620 [Phanerochaete sordida]